VTTSPHERTSKNGNVYLAGRLGAARLTILKSRDTADDGGAIWEVLLQEGPPPKAAASSPARDSGDRPSGEPQRRRPEAEPDT
jgi:hypothetical protein